MAPSKKSGPHGRIAWSVVLLLAFSCAAYSQSRGTIQGQAVDGNRAVVPNAKVTVFCDCSSPECGSLPCSSCCPTAFSKTITTADDGTFRVTDLPAGNYSVKGESSGFAVVTVKGVKVELGAAQTVELTFGVGSVDTIRVLPATTLTGSVINDLDRHAIANATVTISRRNCDCRSECPKDPCDSCCPYETAETLTTDKDGRFTTKALPGDYKFKVEVGPFSKESEMKVKLARSAKVKIGLDLQK
jgi:hypothetical protein